MTFTQPKYQTQQEYQLIVLQPQGYLDEQLGKSLNEQLSGLAQESQQLWVIDLAQVNFINSSGLVALVAAQKAARSSGCRLVICNLQPPVQIVFELAQLDSVFEIFDTYDAVLTTVNACS
ncbi:anti-sigma-factor antagonist [Calothrix sp. NIES-4071]|nr:anti-sigma-factor antagonist [Calothrix sp. NIES-4071]BAZ59473.1 anti-sigma-factor antagonist [Calothrix sp. NIES-4105]